MLCQQGILGNPEGFLTLPVHHVVSSTLPMQTCPAGHGKVVSGSDRTLVKGGVVAIATSTVPIQVRKSVDLSSHLARWHRGKF